MQRNTVLVPVARMIVVISQQLLVRRFGCGRLSTNQIQFGDCMACQPRILALGKCAVKLAPRFVEIATLPEGHAEAVASQRTLGLDAASRRRRRHMYVALVEREICVECL